MKKFVTISLFLISQSLYAQFKPMTLGVGIGNQYAVYGGARLALAISPKIEPSISFGASPSQTETTLGVTYYFQGIGHIMNFNDQKFDWPTAIAFGGNLYKKLFDGDEFPIGEWDEEDYGLSMLFIYKIKPRRLFGYTNTPLYERRLGFGATYIIGKPTDIIVLPSLMFGADFRLPIKFKGFLL